MKFACFGGSAAVADDAAIDAVAARHRSHRRRKLLFGGGKGNKKPSSAPRASNLPERSPWHRDREADEPSASASYHPSTSSVPSSSALSYSPSRDDVSACSCSSSCPSPASSSSSLWPSSSASSLLDAMPPAPAKQRQPERRSSPALGAAALIVCLVMTMLCGRVAATMLASTAFYFFPRRWRHARSRPEGAAASTRQDEETIKRKVVMEGFLERNRTK